MRFYRKLLYLFIVTSFGLSGCSSSDDASNGPLAIKLTSFQPSYGKVILEWKLSRSGNIIIESVSVMRQTSEDWQPENLGTVPSNSVNYTDNDVPYYPEVSYFVKIGYRDENRRDLGLQIVESEIKTFTRNIILLKTVPSQVTRDPLNSDDFHITDRLDMKFLKKYNALQNKIVAEKSFENSSLYSNRFFIRNSSLFLMGSHGNLHQLNTSTYESEQNYQVNVQNRVNAFSVNADRIYYIDGEIFKFFTISTGVNTNLHWGLGLKSLQALNDYDILCTHQYPNDTGAVIYRFTPQNCQYHENCDPETLAFTERDLDGNDMDANILTYNSSKTLLISGRDGNIYNLIDLSRITSLSNITAEPYFQFAFDTQNNIYATVQGKKLVHKFKADTFELIETIETKLYPLYPLTTSNGLIVIGGYSPVSYWGPYEAFSFDSKCAIEIFE